MVRCTDFQRASVELRNKRSLKLFEDCIDKLVKFEPTPPPPPPQQWNGPSDGNKAKYAMSKLADAYSGAQKPNWLNELTKFEVQIFLTLKILNKSLIFHSNFLLTFIENSFLRSTIDWSFSFIRLFIYVSEDF